MSLTREQVRKDPILREGLQYKTLGQGMFFMGCIMLVLLSANIFLLDLAILAFILFGWWYASKFHRWELKHREHIENLGYTVKS